MSLRIDLSRMSHTAAMRQLDLSSLPAVHNRSGSRFGGIFLVLFALFWGGIPGLIFISLVTSGEYESSMFFLLLFPVIGIGIFLGGLYTMTFRETIRIDANSVSREAKSIFGYKYWTEPLERYSGVLSRTEQRSGGKNSSPYTVYIVELYHEDKKKRILLYESRSGNSFRTIWEDYCRQLNKPAMERAGNKMHTRDVADLDKSVRELVQEGKITVDFDPKAPPPKGFDARVAGGQLRVALPKKNTSFLGLIIAILFTGVFIFIGFWVDDAPVIFGIIGIILLLFFIGAGIWQAITRNVLLIGRNEIKILQETPWGETGGSILKADEIEEVRIGPIARGTKQMAVLLVTDHNTRRIGDGLPRESQEWLKNCILAVITRG